ncbi:MAG: ubiquinol-cytochrome c reductase iron-sulfur subunit [Dichotomicrobium sp.]
MASAADDPNRRDFIHIATSAFLVIGGAAALWPAIDQMNPSEATLAAGTVDVDISPIEQGQAITVMWRGKPVFVRHRTDEEIEAAKAVDVSDLKDPLVNAMGPEAGQPATDENLTKSGHERWLVVIGICTHLGCIPKGQKSNAPRGDFGGWFCPCHGSHYDTAGRIRIGPAPRNLELPLYSFTSDTTIQLG